MPIWRDDLQNDDVDGWKDEWLQPAAGDVVRSIGAWIICLDLDALQKVQSFGHMDAAKRLGYLETTSRYGL